MYLLKRSLPIGEWKYIENFTVSAAVGKYRLTPEPYKINFTSDTLISRSVFHDDNPFLTLASYEDIGNGKLNPNVLIGMNIFTYITILTISVL